MQCTNKKKMKEWANSLKRYIQNCDKKSTSKLSKIKRQQSKVLSINQDVHSRLDAHALWWLIQFIMDTINIKKKDANFDDCISKLKRGLYSLKEDSIIGNALKEAIL